MSEESKLADFEQGRKQGKKEMLEQIEDLIAKEFDTMTSFSILDSSRSKNSFAWRNFKIRAGDEK